MSAFYVYEHWRTDRDECFYVGKGKGRRAYILRDRNSHHRGIVAKLIRMGFAVEIRIVASGLIEDEAFQVERDRIAFWRSSGVDITNVTDGGDGVSGLKMSDESKKKMSDAKKGKPGRATMLGKKHSDETRAKMSAAQKGVKKSPEHAAKVGARHKGKKVVVSPETAKKISEAHRGRKHTEETKQNMRNGWIVRKMKQGEVN